MAKWKAASAVLSKDPNTLYLYLCNVRHGNKKPWRAHRAAVRDLYNIAQKRATDRRASQE